MRRVGVDVERKEKGACVVVEFIVTTETIEKRTIENSTKKMNN